MESGFRLLAGVDLTHDSVEAEKCEDVLLITVWILNVRSKITLFKLFAQL